MNLVNKGWSEDKKYYIETTDGKMMLLRIAVITRFENKRAEFEIMKQIEVLDVPVSRPIDFGICDNGNSVYTLFTWCDGEDLEVVLPLLTESEQYKLG